MDYNIYGVRLIVRILLIGICSLLFAFIVLQIPEKHLVAIPAIILGMLIFEIWELIYYINSTNREIARFMSSFRSKDFALNISPSGISKSATMLLSELELYIKEFRTETHKVEAINYYRDEIIKHLSFGVITINEIGEITLINKPALALFQKQSIKNFNELKEAMPSIANEIEQLLPSGEKLIEVGLKKRQKLLLLVSTLIIQRKKFAIISFQDIGKEINKRRLMHGLSL
jgi:two-component system nitrogen regulation sensor histidine kinase NtrY